MREHQATVIWDQGLSPWTSGYAALAAQPDIAGQLLLIGEAFPGMGLSSWFIGYIASPEGTVPPMQSQKQIMAICTSTPAQYAALEASKLYGAAHPQTMQRIGEKRQKIAASLANIAPGTTATIVAVRFAADEKAQALARLSEAGYVVADGADFGAPDLVRLTISLGGAAEQAANLIQG
jgi:aspartate/methionine/tyrosine aminotransferase